MPIFIVTLMWRTNFLLMAQDHIEHEVEEGETLSEIIQRYFPDEKIYGEAGKLQEVIRWNNSIIQDPDLIFTEQKIYLQKVKTFEPPDYEPLELAESAVNQDHWPILKKYKYQSYYYTQVQYGAGILRFQQNNTLGDATVSGAIYHWYEVEIGKVPSSENLWSWSLGAGQGYFDFTNEGASTKTLRLSNYKGFLYFQHWGPLLGVGVRVIDHPLMKNNGGQVEGAKVASSWLGVSFKEQSEIYLGQKLIDISYSIEAMKLLHSSMDPAYSSAQSHGLASTSGWRFHGSLAFDYELYKQLHMILPIELGYMRWDATVEWGTSQGKVLQKSLLGSAQLGLRYFWD